MEKKRGRGKERRRGRGSEEEEEKKRSEDKKRHGTNLGSEFLYEFPYNCMVISCTLT